MQTMNTAQTRDTYVRAKIDAGTKARAADVLAAIPVRILVPNTHDADFIDECKMQTASLHNEPHEKEILAWIEAAYCQEGWK